MTRRAALNVSLTPELVAYITAQVNSGRYGSASEVVRASLRLLQQAEQQPPSRELARQDGTADAR
jgi:antitoxin ParD1/3/4